jgi:outer membrane protein TolC
VAAAPLLVWAQSGAIPSGPPTAQAQQAATIPNLSSAQQQGSVPSGTASARTLPLTLDEAVERGLRANLGILVRDSGSATARAARLKALSALLPSVTGSISENAQQTNLRALGIDIPFAPKIAGPFGYTDARASASATLFDWTAFRNLKMAAQSVKAAELSAKDAETLVVQSVSNAYFLAVADTAQIQSLAAQIDVAKALYSQALDQKTAGTGMGLDATRALVQLRTQQQLLLAQTDQLEKDKLTLARLIGLPLGQAFVLTDAVSASPPDIPAPDAALRAALMARADYRGQEAQVAAARLAIEAARGERYPALSLNSNYGAIGPNLGNSHGTFAVTGALKFNIFDGGRIRSDVDQAEAALRQRENELEDLKGQIDYQIRTALFDLRSIREQVEVAKANVDLANQSLGQSRERFAAGVTNTVEIVQAQQQVAAAEQSLIAAEYSFNVARSSLNRALGGTRSAQPAAVKTEKGQGEEKK